MSRPILFSDWESLPELVKYRLLLLDLDVRYQMDLHYPDKSPKQLKFKGSRWRMQSEVIAHTRKAWLSFNRHLYPLKLMYIVYAWIGRHGFTIIHSGKVGWWRQEWDDYPYLYFLQLPDPPSYNSFYKKRITEDKLSALEIDPV